MANNGERRENHDVPGLLKNITWLGAANVAVKPFWFLFVTAACMRLLGVQEYGVMNAALSLTLIAVATVNLGTTRYSVREISRAPERASEFFSNFLVLRIGNSVFGWVAALALGWILGYGSQALLAVCFAGLYAVSLNITDYCRGMYEAMEDLRQQSVMLIVEKSLVILMGSALLWTTQSAHWTLAGMGTGMALTTLFNVMLIDRRFAKLRPALVSRSFLLPALRQMLPFGVAALFTVVYYRVDMVMIEAMLGETPTGQYGAAFRILEALNMLPAIVVTSALYPRLARLQAASRFRDFRSLFSWSMAGLFIASLAIAVALFFAASVVIGLLDPSPTYTPAVGALEILVWSYPFFCANSLLYAALVSLDDQTFISWCLLIAVILNVSVNLALIPEFGIEGASLATVGPEVVLSGIFGARLVYRWRMGNLETQPKDGLPL